MYVDEILKYVTFDHSNETHQITATKPYFPGMPFVLILVVSWPELSALTSELDTSRNTVFILIKNTSGLRLFLAQLKYVSAVWK